MWGRKGKRERGNEFKGGRKMAKGVKERGLSFKAKGIGEASSSWFFPLVPPIFSLIICFLPTANTLFLLPLSFIPFT